MGRDAIRYYRVRRNGRAFWEPTPAMRAEGFASVPLGQDGPEARSLALTWNERWDAHRRGVVPGSRPVWPRGSLGEAWDRFVRTNEFAGKEPRTREEWHRCWKRIAPIFGDVAPATIDFATMDTFYGDPEVGLLATIGVREAHRVVKIWRALWRVAAAMHYCERDADPSLGIRRKTPPPRQAVWREGEVVRLVKRALRMGYHGLACVVAVAWDTQFAPVDVRQLSAADKRERAGCLRFDLAGRQKTDVAAVGTLTPRTERLVRAYLAASPAHALPTAPLFRNRSGRAYSKDTLGDDFRDVRAVEFPGDGRTIGHDMRRSGTVEAFAGGADAGAVSAKMANSLNQSAELQRTYNPVDLASVQRADDARRTGRRRIRENG